MPPNPPPLPAGAWWARPRDIEAHHAHSRRTTLRRISEGRWVAYRTYGGHWRVAVTAGLVPLSPARLEAMTRRERSA